MSLTVAEVKDLLEITSTDHDTVIAALLPLVTAQINEYCSGAFSRQVKEEEVTFTVSGTTGYKSLTKTPVVRKSVYITSTDRSERFYGDTGNCDLPVPTYLIPSTYVEDYVMDYEGGRIWIPSTYSQIDSTQAVLVTYSYIDLVGGGKIAAARLIQQQYSSPSGIGSESVGSLSRSYVGASMGIDAIAGSLLAAYKRPRFV